ncbi:MAG TPA: hypothetical protein IAC31_08530 [Candidatus Faecousia intestinigallinarum]|nr:hypothetical protein [Candidatus Faecousia intestinigallinarum]
MKRTIALILAVLALGIAAAGCAPAGGNAETTQQTNPALTEELSVIIDNIYTQQPLEIAVSTQEVDISDTEFALKSFTGLSSNELIQEAAVSESMIGSIAYSMVLVRVKDAKDARSVAEEMKAGIDQRKWICVEADDLMVAGYGDVVMLIMVSSAFAEEGLTAQTMVDAFAAVCGGTLDFTI